MIESAEVRTRFVTLVPKKLLHEVMNTTKSKNVYLIILFIVLYFKIRQLYRKNMF